jgi:phage terminase large subunit-like protein
VSDYCEKSARYIDAVLSGRFITNRWTKLACKRQQDDLAKQDQEFWKYFFSEDAANDVCDFLECLTHVKGKMGGQPFHLEDWECFIVCTLFGWKQKSNPSLRRYRRSFLEMGKGNGKSFISSGLALYMLAADSEPGSEVLCVARSKDQSKVVFDTTREIARANPQLCSLFDIKPLQDTVTHGTSCTMRAATNQSKSLAGTLPHFIVADETWAWPKVELLEECERAVDKRDNSMLSTITHAAAGTGSVGYQQHETACAILSGELVDERTFVCVWSSEGYAWTDAAALIAANPCLGVSVYEDTLTEARDRAVKVPALQVSFRAKNLCEWIGSDITWIDPMKLDACREKNLCMEDFKFWKKGEPNVEADGALRPFTVGLDLSKRMDLCAVVYLTMAYRENAEHYFAFGEYFLPEETLANSPIAKYRSLAASGNIQSMPGPTNDLEQIQRGVLSKFKRYLGYGAVENPDGYNFVLASYDAWQAQQMQGNLEKAGLPSVPFEKTSKYYSPTMEFFAALVAEGRFHFPYEDGFLLWCFQNIVCHYDRNNNVFPNRASDDRKIDGAISLLYALRAAMTNGGDIMRVTKQSCPMMFFFDDGIAPKIPDGKGGLKDVPGPKEERHDASHPADREMM